MKKTRAAPAPKTSQEQAAASDVAAIVAGVHGNAFAVLGVQQIGGKLVARCFIPHAETVTAFTLAGKQVGELSRRDDAGFFEGQALHPQAPAAALPRRQCRRRMVGDRSLFVRPGARADGRLLHCRGLASAPVRQARLASDVA